MWNWFCKDFAIKASKFNQDKSCGNDYSGHQPGERLSIYNHYILCPWNVAPTICFWHLPWKCIQTLKLFRNNIGSVPHRKSRRKILNSPTAPFGSASKLALHRLRKKWSPIVKCLARSVLASLLGPSSALHFARVMITRDVRLSVP